MTFFPTLERLYGVIPAYWWRKTSGAPPCIISAKSGHISKTNGIPLASGIAKIQVPGGIRTHRGEGESDSSQRLHK